MPACCMSPPSTRTHQVLDRLLSLQHRVHRYELHVIGADAAAHGRRVTEQHLQQRLRRGGGPPLESSRRHEQGPGVAHTSRITESKACLEKIRLLERRDASACCVCIGEQVHIYMQADESR